MKSEQEIVLQKKIIIIFSLAILAVVMGILNIQKQNIKLANSSEVDDIITKVYTVYTANEELFKIEVSGELSASGELISGDAQKESLVLEKVENEKKAEVKENDEIEANIEKLVNEDEQNQNITNQENTIVASRGSYQRDVVTPPTEYEKVIQVKATAYCLCKKCCGKSPDNPRYGYTASGIRIVPGTGMKVIAVDTSMISLGTNVYVEGLNGAANYGYAIAADTGSAIKGNKIDLYMDTHQQALAWGVKYVNLYILSGDTAN